MQASANASQGYRHLRLALKYSFYVLVLLGLYLTTHINYLLFHSLAELFSIVVAFCVFVIAWNSRKYIENSYLLFIGVAYFFIALLDLLHTLSYKGMPIFTDYDYYANQLWIGARAMESVTLVLGFAFLRSPRKINVVAVFWGYVLATALMILSVFYWKVFPECFVEGVGLTPFKKTSEYVICAVLLLAMGLLWHNRQRFAPLVYRLLFSSIICTIISELAFTFYVSNYGISNLLGHYFKLFSFYLIYVAIIETGLREPYELVFRELDEANKRLQTALAEIKTLQGIIPICANCKKIRDDRGYWNRLESYISAHSRAKFSHGICPDCMRELYPEMALEMEEENGAVEET